jgi:peptidoglycan/xylan/chitin deacetylase (PgdA/CDA1 family)
MSWAPLAVGAAGLAALGTGMGHPNSPLFGSVIGRGPRAGKRLYLTFDDGPSPSATDWILETLAREEAPAAFFLVGSHVRRFPELARRVAASGNLVANHTEHHTPLLFRGPRRTALEIEVAHQTIAEVLGRPPVALRAPMGLRNPFVAPVARELGYPVFGWTFHVRDWRQPPAEELRRRVRARLRPGAIILLHDGDGFNPLGDRRETAAALPGIIRDARDAGYEFRSLGELAG